MRVLVLAILSLTTNVLGDLGDSEFCFRDDVYEVKVTCGQSQSDCRYGGWTSGELRTGWESGSLKVRVGVTSAWPSAKAVRARFFCSVQGRSQDLVPGGGTHFGGGRPLIFRLRPQITRVPPYVLWATPGFRGGVPHPWLRPWLSTNEVDSTAPSGNPPACPNNDFPPFSPTKCIHIVIGNVAFSNRAATCTVPLLLHFATRTSAN